MPELPEVTVIVNSLNRKISGLTLDSVEYDWPKKFFWGRRPGGASGPEGKYSIKDLKGAKVEGVRRIGKIVIINLTKDEGLKTNAQKSLSRSSLDVSRFSILIHLKLTGQLIYQDKKIRVAGGHPIPPLNLPVPNKTTRVTFAFTNPSTGSGQVAGHLYFNDVRKFGWVKIVGVDRFQPEADHLLDEKIKEAVGTLGPDPLVMSYEEFRERLAKKSQGRIKKVLMDQTVISGVGNIYSDEALWRAKIHPKRSAISLSPSEIRNLYEGIKKSLKLAIDKGGSSANSFVDSGGERGLFLTFAKAYHMTGRPCERCKTPIVREKMDGRSAHFCPNCQKLK